VGKEQNKMSKKVETPRPQKVPRTVKVSTVIISVIVFAALVASFITGWFARSNFDSTIRQEVSSTVKELSTVTSKE
jgi:maleate cis-trans isomerase